MKTVIETPTFQKQAEKIWTEDERFAFIDWIADNPLAGDVIPGTDGARKVRWSLGCRGKRGGVRIIYYNRDARGVVILVMIYTKAERSNVKPNEIERGD